MRKIWIKRITFLLLIPILFFFLLIVLLYIPSVQNAIQRKAMEYASEASGMDISIRRVDLRFPLNLLVRDVAVVDQKDTVLSFERLSIRVQALPLLRGKIELDEFTLKQALVNSGNIIDGIRVEGNLGEFRAISRGVDLTQNTVRINKVFLDKADFIINLTDTTTTEKEEEDEGTPWRIFLDELNSTDFNVDVRLPYDDLILQGGIPTLKVTNLYADLINTAFGLDHISLSEGSLVYKQGEEFRDKGLDPSFISIDSFFAELDSIHYSENEVAAKIKDFRFNEKSGMQIDNLSGNLAMTESTLFCSDFLFKTPYSHFDLDLILPLDWCSGLESKIDANLVLSLRELALILGVTVEEADFAEWGPISCRVLTEGNKDYLELKEVYAELAESFSLFVEGTLSHSCLADKRLGQLDILGDFYDLSRFESWISEEGDVKIPLEMTLKGLASASGADYRTDLYLEDGSGKVAIKGAYNSTSEKYAIQGVIDSLDINRFLPAQPLYDLSFGFEAKGQGIDVLSKKAVSDVSAELKNLRYSNYILNQIGLTAKLENESIRAALESNNALLKADVKARYLLNVPHLNLDVGVNVADINLFELGVLDEPLKEPIQLKGLVKTTNDSINLALSSGDLRLDFTALNSVENLIKESEELMNSFLAQLKANLVDYKDLQSKLPKMNLSWQSGNKNALSSILGQKHIKYKESSADFSINSLSGVQGLASVRDFQLDSLRLDTLFLELSQDSSKLEMKTGIAHKGKKTETSFRTFLKGMLLQDRAELSLDFENGAGVKGMLFGIEMKPEEAGTQFSILPENPIVAFQKFDFKDKKNWLFLRDDLRLFSNIDLEGENRIGFKMYSNLNDTISLQNMNIDVRRIDLRDVTNLFPFMPEIDGFFSAEAHYVQSDSTLQVSSELFLDSLHYEKKPVGNLGIGLTWLPDGKNTDLLNMYLTHNYEEVFFGDGLLRREGDKEVIDIEAYFEHFPLHIADVLFPNEEVNLEGDIDGYIHITGTPENPVFNGEIVLDSVSVYAKQADARFLFDSRPLQVKDSKLIFDDFSIFTTGQNPFTINGSVNISDLSNPIVDLKMSTDDYTLLDAKRTDESILYGKLFVGVDATLKGPVSALNMRGQMSILDNTNLTYVLTESPLTVQDRLGDLVTFTSFRDTVDTAAADTAVVSLGGIDMVMAVHIDPSVRFKVDLSSDRSSRIELQGGGDLSLQYTPQGDFSLMGRYSLSDGIVKYALPIIPSKEFKISPESFIEWTGKIDDPKLNLIAKERVRASVAESDGSSHMVNFDVIIGAKNRLENLELIFDLHSPDNATVQNQLASMDKEERSKQAIAMLATGVYLAGGGDGKSGLDMGVALNSVLQSQINAIAGSSLKNASFSVGVEEYDMADTGGKRTDYSFRYAQRFLNDRFQLILGGRVKTGVEASNSVESFIDNVSLEYRLDSSGTRYVRLFHNKNYESVLEGEITETGVGLVLRKKVHRLGELFIFKKKKKNKNKKTEKE